jgi:hypothetical protein
MNLKRTGIIFRRFYVSAAFMFLYQVPCLQASELERVRRLQKILIIEAARQKSLENELADLRNKIGTKPPESKDVNFRDILKLVDEAWSHMQSKASIQEGKLFADRLSALENVKNNWNLGLETLVKDVNEDAFATLTADLNSQIKQQESKVSEWNLASMNSELCNLMQGGHFCT